MDDLSTLSDQDAGQTGAPDSAREESNASTNNQGSTGSPRNVSRTITSKRVVLPSSAKRIGKIVPPAPPPPVIEKPELTQDLPSAVPSNGQAPELETRVADIAPQVDVSPGIETIPETHVSPEPSFETPALPDETPTVAAELPKDFDLKPSRVVSPVPALKPPMAGPRPPSLNVDSEPTPYLPPPVTTMPVIKEKPSNRRGLEMVLWGTGILVLIAAVIAVLFALNIIPGIGTPEAVVTPTKVAAVKPTLAPSATTTLLPTSAPTELPPVPTTVPLVIPTPPLDGQQQSFLPDTSLTGWFTTSENAPHYGDDNLNTGTLQGQSLSSVIQFHLANLPTDTKILFAALELTGRDASHLGTDGTWQLELVENSLDTDWDNATPQQLADAKALATIGTPVPASELGAGRLNRWILSDTDLQLLQQQFKNGDAVFRLRGPEGSGDNLFTWESGASGSTLNAPTLHLVYVPGNYVIVTNTPEPTNVLTAAAYVVRGTDQAKRLGTPTRFPPGVATATPGAGSISIDASTAIPGNQETAIALAQRATAFARTTGTYTPVPQTVIIIYPTFTPVVVDPSQLATSTPIPPDTDLLTVPIDYNQCQCKGRILALSNRFGGDKLTPIMLEPDGTIIGKLSGDLYYRLALAREPYSPDRTKRLIYPRNSNGVQQVGYEEIATGAITYLTNFTKGIAYDAAWAPDGSMVAYVSTERGNTDEIWVYDFGTGQNTRITDAAQLGQPWSKHPTWSPDSQQIAIWSSRSGTPQIWIMNRDGSDLHNISNNTFDERDPVWVK